MKIRCPKLGHEVDFNYCRKENNGLPCARALICWSSYFDVEAFFKKELSEQEWKMAFETHITINFTFLPCHLIQKESASEILISSTF